MMPSPGVIAFAELVSRVFGWTYMIAWSLSCYPQAILNFRRRSTVGVNLAFPAINTLGFMCYFTSTAAMYFSPLIRAQYAARNPASPVPTVRGNDVAFAGHALIICFVLLSMFSRSIWGFEQGAIGSGWRVGKGISGVMIGCVVGVTFMVGLVVVKGSDGGRDPESYAWIDVIYAMGLVKLVVTMVKCIPQVLTNYRRQSTVGWSIEQNQLDVLGGVLSVAQLVIDSSLQADWSGLTNNSVKLGLGGLSLFFDMIFITQHYILYRDASRAEKSKEDDLREEEENVLARDDEETPLLR